MLIDIETRHDDWRTVDVGDADDLPEAAHLAIRSVFTFLDDDNHRRRDMGNGTYCGRVGAVRTRPAKLPTHPTLRRLAEMYGANNPGDLWVSCKWREHQLHRAAAIDGQGRRWVMVRLESGYGMWECVDDLTEYRSAVPGPWQPTCCGTPGDSGLIDGACRRCGPPWTLTLDQPATDRELLLLDAVRLDRHLLAVLIDVEAGRCRVPAARDRLGCGRGSKGTATLTSRTRGLARRLTRAVGGRDPWPSDDAWQAELNVDKRTFDEARRDCLRLAGVACR